MDERTHLLHSSQQTEDSIRIEVDSANYKENSGCFGKVGDLLKVKVHLSKIKKDNELHGLTGIRAIRHHLGEFLESVKFQYFILALVVLDLIILSTELILTQEQSNASGFHIAKTVLYWATDAIIITAAILLELIFRDELAGLLAIVRLWRVIRIAHGIVMAAEESSKKAKLEMEQKLKEYKSQIEIKTKELEEARATIRDLEQQLGK